VYSTTYTGCVDDTRLYSYTHHSVTIYVYTICLSLLHFLCLMQFEDTATFKIHTALPVWFSTAHLVLPYVVFSLLQTKRDSLLLLQLYRQCRRIARLSAQVPGSTHSLISIM